MSEFKSPHIQKVLEVSGSFGLCKPDLTQLQAFRVLEPSLVSLADKQTSPPESHWVVGVQAYGKMLGVTSSVIDLNHVKKVSRCRYGRIDLVIVPEFYRGLGISRVMVMAALLEMIAENPGGLYSISCLAGHPAIAHMLEQFGFNRREEEGKEFVHEEFRLPDDEQEEQLVSLLVEGLDEKFQALNYRIRQRQKDFT